MVFTNGEISGLLFAPGLVQATLSHDCNLVRVVKFEHLFIWFSFLNLITCFPIKFYILTWYDHYSLRNTHFEVHIFELLRLRVKLINSGRAFALSQYTSPPRALLWKVCRLSSWLTSAHSETTLHLFQKGKVHSSHSDTSAQSETTLQQFQIRESVKQPTNWRGSANKIFLKAVEGPWQVCEWGREGVWLYCGLGASNPRPGTKLAPGWD